MTIDQHTFNRLIADKLSMEVLLSHYNINHIGVTPFGLLDRVNRHFNTNDNSELHYNCYFSHSLLHNSNKWLDLESLRDLVPFNLK